MGTKELTLNIAVNMGRLCRFASENRPERVNQFLSDTDYYVALLAKAPKSPRFNETYLSFVKQYDLLKQDPKLTPEWAESALTWSNILTHRAKLA